MISLIVNVARQAPSLRPSFFAPFTGRSARQGDEGQRCVSEPRDDADTQPLEPAHRRHIFHQPVPPGSCFSPDEPFPIPRAPATTEWRMNAFVMNGQSRSSSLTLVFDRVFSSTRLTITAQ